jgi:spore maturation protein CgeB
MSLEIVIFGLSITSSWGNGHATTYRALTKALQRRGHRVTFLERDTPWYGAHRDVLSPDTGRVELYAALKDLPRYADLVARADLVMVGSYVPDGIILGDWVTMHATGVTAFYDIDTPVTLSKLDAGAAQYICPALIPRFDLYLSFTGGPVLDLIERRYGSPRARVLYCGVEPQTHAPVPSAHTWDLGYLGTYSPDRQGALEQLLIDPALSLPQRKFVVAGAQYPDSLQWPANIARIEHLPPADHANFYCAQRYTLNVTRADMVATGYAPSVRLFEAAACAVPIISDRWTGLDTLFAPDTEILIADSAAQVSDILCHMPDERRCQIAANARKRVLTNHTADHRARQLEDYYAEVASRKLVRLEERRGVGAVA